MEEFMMNMNELTTWRMIGADMGLEFDELGHPYKQATPRAMSVTDIMQSCFDWRPVENDADAFGLMLHYRLTVQFGHGCVMVKHVSGRTLEVLLYEVTPEKLRLALFHSAATLVREKLEAIDAVPLTD